MIRKRFFHWLSRQLQEEITPEEDSKGNEYELECVEKELFQWKRSFLALYRFLHSHTQNSFGRTGLEALDLIQESAEFQTSHQNYPENSLAYKYLLDLEKKIYKNIQDFDLLLNKIPEENVEHSIRRIAKDRKALLAIIDKIEYLSGTLTLEEK